MTRVICGGERSSARYDCRAATRQSCSPHHKSETIGFRVIVVSDSPSAPKAQQPEDRPNTKTVSRKKLPGVTVVTPYLDRKIIPGKNLMWCATFQMTWDNLKELCGGPVETSPGGDMVSKLNRESTRPGSIPTSGVVSKAGLVGDGIIERIEACLKDIPNTNPHSFLQGETSLTTP